MLARAGVPGLVLWLLTLACWGTVVLTNMVRARLRGDHAWASFFLLTFCYACGFLIDASVDVTLEGPMAGIWFWCVFGVGSGASMIYRSELVRSGALKARFAPSLPRSRSDERVARRSFAAPRGSSGGGRATRVRRISNRSPRVSRSENARTDRRTCVDLASEGRKMLELIVDLFPICRSITGEWLRQSLGRVGELIPYQRCRPARKRSTGRCRRNGTSRRLYQRHEWAPHRRLPRTTICMW